MGVVRRQCYWQEFARMPAELAPLLGAVANGRRTLVPRPESREIIIVPPPRNRSVGEVLADSVVAISSDGVVRSLASPFDFQAYALHYRMALMRSELKLRKSSTAIALPVKPSYYCSSPYGGVFVTPAPGMQGPAAWSVFNQTEWATTLSGSGTVPGSGNRDDYRGRPHFVSDTSGEYIAISVRPVYTGNEKRQLQVLVERTSGSQGTTIAKLDGHRIVWFAGKRMHFLQSEGFTKRNWRHGSISMDRLVEVARASKQPFTSTAYQKQVTSEIEVSPDKLPMDLFSFGGGMADADPISISDVGLLLLTKTINGRIPALLTTDGELLTSSFALSHDWRQQQLLLIEKEPSGCVTLALLLFGRTIDFCVLRLLNGHLTAEVVPVELTEPMKNKDTRDVWSFGAISTSNGPMLIAHADTKVWGWKGEN